jgi:hypothetical protein
MRRNLIALTVNLGLLGGVTVSLFLYVMRTGSEVGINPALLVIAGATTFATLAALRELLAAFGSNSLKVSTVNVEFLSESVSLAFPSHSSASRSPRATLAKEAPWEVTASDLLAVDSTLALAKLRIDLERQLRQLAMLTGIDLSSGPKGITHLILQLEQREALPPTVGQAIREVSRVANNAVHGRDVSQKAAVSVVALGTDIMRVLSDLVARRT